MAAVQMLHGFSLFLTALYVLKLNVTGFIKVSQKVESFDCCWIRL